MQAPLLTRSECATEECPSGFQNPPFVAICENSGKVGLNIVVKKPKAEGSTPFHISFTA